MTKEELDYIQTACREWLKQPSAAIGSRTSIPASGTLSRPVEVERKGILTFDNVRITSAVDTETGACYMKLIEQPDGVSEFFDTPYEKFAPDTVPTLGSESPPMRATQKRYQAAMQRLVDERTDANRNEQAIDPSPWWSENGDSDSDERPKYQLYTNDKLLGHSLLEREGADGRRSGRFHAGENYFEYSHIFVELPEAENDCMEANAREGYGLSDESAGEYRKRFHELSEQIAALKLYLADAGGHQMETAELRVEDLSGYYDDESERWLYVSLALKTRVGGEGDV